MGTLQDEVITRTQDGWSTLDGHGKQRRMGTSWLSALNDSAYICDWNGPGATDEGITELARYFGHPLPDDYAAFLRLTNGADLWYGDLWNIHVWESSEVPSLSAGYGFNNGKMPDAICFGSDGGGEGLVFNIRPQHANGRYPIIAVNFVTIGWQEVIPVAPDFNSLLLLRHELLDQGGSA